MTLTNKRAGASILSFILIFSFGANLCFASDPCEKPRERFVRAAAAKKKPLPPLRYIPNREYDLRHVALDLRFDRENERAIGTATPSLAPLPANTRRAAFDAWRMPINSVKMQSGAGLKFARDEAKDDLIVELDRAYQPGDSLSARLSKNSRGSQWTPFSSSGFIKWGIRFLKSRNRMTPPRRL